MEHGAQKMKETNQKEPQMAEKEMIQYFRGDNRHPIGVMVAIHSEEDVVRIGWSKCNKKDQFDKTKGLKIARMRTLAGSELAIPASREFICEETELVKDANEDRTIEVPMLQVIENLQSQYNIFIERVVTYFKSVNPANFVICGPDEDQMEYALMVTSFRNADLDRQAARKTEQK